MYMFMIVMFVYKPTPPLSLCHTRDSGSPLLIDSIGSPLLIDSIGSPLLIDLNGSPS